jgi:hypothetical protein
MTPGFFALYLSIQLACIPSCMTNHYSKSFGPMTFAQMMEHFFMAGYIPMLVDLHGVAH